MSRSRVSLDVLNVPSPCAVPWASLSGTAQMRFCPDCRKNVHNLSAMTAAEADAVLRAGPDGPCVRFRRRADGTAVTADRGGGRLARATAALSTLFVGLASLAGCDCAQLGICTQGKIVAPAPAPGQAPAPPAPAEDDP